MIYVSENKAQIVKGDFRPAALYKGNKKIAGYSKESFEGEGTITLNNCYNDKLHNAKIYGNTVQDGEPSPENPVEMQSVGDLVTEGEHAGKYRIGVVAKNTVNLFDKNNVNFRNAYIRTASNQLLQMDDSRSALIECQPNTTYTIRHTFENKGMFRACYINYEPPTSGWFGTNAYAVTQASSTDVKELTVATGDECTYLVVQMPLETYEEWIKHLEVTTSQEEPRRERVDIYLDEPLRKIGDYEDYIDFENKKVIRNLRRRAFIGTEVWYRENYRLFASNGTLSAIESGKLSCASNRLKGYSWVELFKNSFLTTKQIGVAQMKNVVNITPAQTVPSIDEWKAQLATWNDEGNPLEVIFVDTAREEAIEKFEIPTFRGTTVYEIETQITAKTSGEYKKTEE